VSKKKIKRKLKKGYGKVSEVWGSIRMRNLEAQKKLVHGTDWDTLIVLDACRYDYFFEEYSQFLKGFLKPVKSPASWTYEWLNLIFDGNYDIDVYGGHPVLNSMGREIHNYKAKDHFKRIVDVWSEGWDDELGTVHPDSMNTFVLKDIKEGKFKGKTMIWYMQPHAPWVGKTKLTEKRENWDDKEALKETWKKLRAGEIPTKELRTAYRENLQAVLKSVSKLLPYLNGKVVITADHGELLGDKRWLPKSLSAANYEHCGWLCSRKLRTVPWFEVAPEEVKGQRVEGSKGIKKTSRKDDEDAIRKRLADLGYM